MKQKRSLEGDLQTKPDIFHGRMRKTTGKYRLWCD
jgi:hypothetical protein